MQVVMNGIAHLREFDSTALLLLLLFHLQVGVKLAFFSNSLAYALYFLADLVDCGCRVTLVLQPAQLFIVRLLFGIDDRLEVSVHVL